MDRLNTIPSQIRYIWVNLCERAYKTDNRVTELLTTEQSASTGRRLCGAYN